MLGLLRWVYVVPALARSYTDPALFQTMTSGTVSLFNSRDRFFQFASGRP